MELPTFCEYIFHCQFQNNSFIFANVIPRLKREFSQTKPHHGNREKIDRKYSGGARRETVERRGAKEGFPLPHTAGTLG